MLSIVVVCRNYEAYAAACLRSVMATDEECEIVFADNGSRDGSVEVARETLREAPPNIATKVVPLTPEQPMCRFFNIAVSESRGDVVKIISADDMLGPNFYSAARTLIDTSDERVGIWLAGSVLIDVQDKVLSQQYPILFGSPNDGPAKPFVERHVLDSRLAPPYTAVSMFYRRKVFDDVGGYDERFRYEDRPFLFNVLKRGWKVVVHPYNNTYYRQHGQSSSSNADWMAEARMPILIDHARRAEWGNKPLAAFHLARGARYLAMKRWRKWRSGR